MHQQGDEGLSEEKARNTVRQRAGGQCEAAIPNICSGHHDSVHHRRKRRYADTRWVVSNLVAVCGDGTRGCHGYIEANPNWSSQHGLWLWEFEDPRTQPVHMRWANQRSWWLLDDEGMLKWVPESDFEPVVLAKSS